MSEIDAVFMGLFIGCGVAMLVICGALLIESEKIKRLLSKD